MGIFYRESSKDLWKKMKLKDNLIAKKEKPCNPHKRISQTPIFSMNILKSFFILGFQWLNCPRVIFLDFTKEETEAERI